MSVPLDRLYHYIENLIREIYNDDVIIYRFYPHGSKKFTDLSPLKPNSFTWKEKKVKPQIFCNDQEPLNYDLYDHIPEDQLPIIPVLANVKKHGLIIPRKNFRVDTFVIWDCALLLHSEQRSPELKKYQNCDFIPVYYWSHAVIARDWFRYAEHIDQQKKSEKLFLIYARAWTGTREYRLKFLDLLVKNNLHSLCKTHIQPMDKDTSNHYHQHIFLNKKWRPNEVLENYFPTKNIPAEFSADFDLKDYEDTDIEIVLETLFDDSRLHFTEKILRPIALGQPFILMGSCNGLEYLRSYGFKTFSKAWSEDYDQIQDPEQRMQAVIDLIKSLSNLDIDQRNHVMQQAREIAEYNKKRFFSQEFFNTVIDELKTNTKTALEHLKNTNIGQTWYNIREQFKDNTAVQTELSKIRSQQDTDEIYNILLKYREKNLKQNL